MTRHPIASNTSRLSRLYAHPRGHADGERNHIAATDPGNDFAIGRGNGQGGQQELHHWDGGGNNFIGMQSSFGATDLASYFESIGEEFAEQSWYSDLTSFAGLGEDPYPSVVDTLGALAGG